MDEAFSDLVKGWVAEAESVATCRVAYAETMSAFNRRLRCGELPDKDYGRLMKSFSNEWEAFVSVDFDELDAGRLVAKHGLRGFDALHLSAAGIIRSAREGVIIAFSSFDQKLNEAAAAEGFSVLGGPAS